MRTARTCRISDAAKVLPLAFLVAAALGVGAQSASAQNVVCGDRLCSEVPGGYSAWEEQMAESVRNAIDKEAGADHAEDAMDKEAGADHMDGAMDKETGADHMDGAMDKEAGAEGAMVDAAGADAEAQYRQMAPTMTELAENVYHYFAGGYSTLVVVSEDDVLITDAANEARALMLKESIAGITDVAVTKVALSHEHYDHAGGTGVFEGAEIICQANCQALFDLDPFDVTPEKVDTEFDDFLSIDIGGIEVQLHHFAPADGEATTIFYLPAEKILLTTDLYVPMGLTDSMWMDDSNYLGIRAIYQNIADWEITHAVNAHSPGTDPADLRAHMEFVEDLYNAVYTPLSAAADDPAAYFGLAASLPNTLTLEKYAGWIGYEENFSKHVQRMALAIIHGD